MTEILLQYGLFLAQAITIVVAILAVVVIAFAVGRRDGGEQSLEVQCLIDRFDQFERQLRLAVISKSEYKAQEKARKKAHKAQAKAKKKALRREKPAENEADSRRRVFVLNFKGDIKASAVASLREEITALLTFVRREDEVVVRLDNAGGLVHEHGLAASQLMRIKDHGVKLVVAVDKVAASGGYMMACVADRIVAAPFAILGSIGVLLQLPNFHRLLDAHGVEFEQVKGGEYKRNLTLFGENSDADRDKAQQDVEDTHSLFKQFVVAHRPQLDLDKVATGEHWYGLRAKELALCDELQTSDDYLLSASKEADIYALEYATPKSFGKRLAGVLESAWDALLARYVLTRRYGGLSL